MSASIDILLATHNGEKYIAEQIESLQNQTFTDWRLLVSDDGSTDRTVDIVEEMQKEDPRIEFVPDHEPTGSSTNNFMYLLGQSTAPYVMFCDQDDVWLPEKVSDSMAAMEELEAGSEIGLPLLVFSDSRVVDESLNVLNRSHVSTMSFSPESLTIEQLMVNNVAQGSTMLLNRALVDDLEKHPVPTIFEHHDYWAVAIAKAKGKASYMNRQTLLYRQHSGNVVGASEQLSLTGRLVSMAKTFFAGGWMHAMAEREKNAPRRARELLLAFPKGQLVYYQELKLVESLEEMNRFKAIGVMRRHKMFRNLGLYAKTCQAFGVLCR